MKKLIILSLLAMFLPLSTNLSAEETVNENGLKEGFVPVDLMETYQIDLTPSDQADNKVKADDPKVLFFDVDIMMLKLNYDFENTESALKSIRPK